ERPAVAADGEVRRPARIEWKLVEQPGRGHVPESDDRILADREHGPAVRMEGPRSDAAVMLEDRTGVLARGQIPQPFDPRRFLHEEGPAVAAEGRESRKSILLRMAEEGVHESSGNQVPYPALAEIPRRRSTLSARDADRTVRVISHPFDRTFER